jgi:hypothetical protein
MLGTMPAAGWVAEPTEQESLGEGQTTGSMAA